MGDENESCPHNRHAILCGLCTPAPKDDDGLTLGDIEAFLTKHALQLRVYFDRGEAVQGWQRERPEWCASLYAKGALDLVPNQPQTFVYGSTMGAAVEDVIRQWRLSYGGAS